MIKSDNTLKNHAGSQANMLTSAPEANQVWNVPGTLLQHNPLSVSFKQGDGNEKRTEKFSLAV
jgi:hypothetical protein